MIKNGYKITIKCKTFKYKKLIKKIKNKIIPNFKILYLKKIF